VSAVCGRGSVRFSCCVFLHFPRTFPRKPNRRVNTHPRVFRRGTSFFLFHSRLCSVSVTLSRVFSQATSVMFLFVRCTAIDPTDRTSFRKKKKKKRETLNATPKLNYGFILGQIVIRFFRRVERKLLRTFIKRKYLDPLKTSPQMEPLLPFPLVMKDDDDAIAPDLKEDDISFCALCDFEVLQFIWFVG